jgi:hypothetical protein
MRQILAILALGLFAFTAYAQDAPKRPSPEEMKQMMESSMGAMVPMMGKMAEASVEAQLSAAEKPETARRIAQFKRNLYDALLQQGFSKDRAFSIMLSTSLPSAGGGLRQ